MTTTVQKSLLGLSVFVAIILVALLTSKKFTLESRRNALLLEMVANISTDLDRLDNGFDTIVSRTEVAKGQLRRLAAIHRDNLMLCALLHEKHTKKQTLTEKGDQYDTSERKNLQRRLVIQRGNLTYKSVDDSTAWSWSRLLPREIVRQIGKGGRRRSPQPASEKIVADRVGRSKASLQLWVRKVEYILRKSINQDRGGGGGRMASGKKACGPCGPGYPSPRIAMTQGIREKILYVVCIQPDPEKPDVLATVDVDPSSSTYSQIIHKLRMPNAGDELHHSGWNICSSCHDSPKKRDVLVLPSLVSDRVYFVDVSNEKEPKIKKTLEPEEMHKWGLATPHTSHCSPTGEIIISTMGKPNGDALGSFLAIDSDTLETKGAWSKDETSFGYDFWYQPHHDVLVSSEWGIPRVFKRGFSPSDVTPDTYGHSLNFYSWSERKLIQTLDLGEEGTAPLEIRFLHDPKSAEGFVGCAIMANVYRFFKTPSGQWAAEKVIDIPSKKVEGWISPEIHGMVTDILLSLDDKYLYLSNWLHGDVRQYDITDPKHPVLKGQVFLGGSVLSDGKIRVLEDKELDKQPDPVFVKGRRLHGAPQMLQLSLDGRRLYVTTSIFSIWDKQFYPEQVKNGSTMVKLDVDVENGGMTLDENFLIDFGADHEEILLAHEMRYPGGDCTSDIWLPEK